jgi:transcriptional regulator with XRE-family HTH domain
VIKQELITALTARRDAAGLSNAEIAERSGLTERSVRNALSLKGNPLVDAIGLELQLAPKGFGESTAPDDGYRPVATRVGHAIAQAPSPPPYANKRRRSP